MKPTQPTREYFHKVVDCQWACPAHTPVPQYIGLIAERRFTEAYMVNWHSNVFPGILGRTCDRPCEPACRRGRVEKDPVAICRLKRVAADKKSGIERLLPVPASRNGKRVAFVGGGPASLSAARDLNIAGYHCTVFDVERKAGGMMRSRIPHFRVPEAVIDEETNYVLDAGVQFRTEPVTSLKALLASGWDAIFVGSGAPRGLDLAIPGRAEIATNIHIATDWLASVTFKHIERIGRRVLVIGGGNTAMDSARTARRIGGEAVTLVNRGARTEMRAALWEQDEATREGVAIRELLSPKCFVHDGERLRGVEFDCVQSIQENGKRRLVPTGKTELIECDDVILALGQEAAFPWIERDMGIAFSKENLPLVDPITFQSTHPKVFFGGDAAFGARNIVTAVAHGREAALSIHLALSGLDPRARPSARTVWTPGKVKLLDVPPHAPDVSDLERQSVAHQPAGVPLRLSTEVELGFEEREALKEAQRCLHCESQTLYETPLCVECKACEQVCPTSCITFTKNGEEAELRTRLNAPAANTAQDLLVGSGLISGRVMIRNEDICLHCGLCAENCPTGAWRIEDLWLEPAHAGGRGEISSKAPEVRQHG